MEGLPPIFMDLAIILVAAGVITVVFKWLKQPLVLGYILAGFFIGPYFPWFPAITDEENLHVWSDIGIVFLMFGLGLEFSIKKLKKVGGTGAITALTELAIMFLIGSSVGKILGFSSMECTFLGCMLSISSTSIIIKSFDDMKLKQQKFTSTVTAVLVVEDLVAVLLLVILSTVGVSKSFDGGALAGQMVKLTFFLVAWFVFGIYLIPTFLRWMRRYMTEETLLILAVGLCFGMVVLASRAGFSTALGAFVMGAILSETIEADVIHRIVTPLKNLFGAVFFVSVGMLIQPAVLVKHWLAILVIALTVIFFKSLSATIGVALSGRPLKTAVQSGFCFCQIGEFSFIIAALGLTIPGFNQDLYPIIVSVSILTTFVTPYMIKGALPFYGWLEPKIPSPVKRRLDQYSENANKDTGDKQGIRTFVQKQLINIFIYSVILAAISLLSTSLLRPLLDGIFADAGIPQIWSRLTGLVATLLLMSPFLWAVAVKNVSKDRFRQIFETYRHSQAVVIPVMLLRYFVALFFVGLVVGSYVNLAVGFLMVVAVMVLFVVLFSRKANGFYAQIEERFFSNFNSRQAQASFHIPKGMENEFSMERLRMTAYSPLVGKSLAEGQLREHYGANIVTIERGDQIIDLPGKEAILMSGDLLTVIGTEEQVSKIRADIEVEPDMLVHDRSDHELHMYRYRVDPDGPLCGVEVANSPLSQHRAMVIAIERQSEPHADGSSDTYKLVNPSRDTVFRPGDLLWFVSPEEMTLHGFESKMVKVQG
ncbi:MAG: cation:proton antiporter [Bacteroidales bacterium]|nr:cation:proton antiporter [Bacteroidales bacterium]